MTEGGRRGLAIIVWGLLGCLLLYAVQHAAGLKYVQGVIWPTDIYAFQKATEGPIDVAILGSSRASFAVSPDQLDSCLGLRLPGDFQSVNLARTFATAQTTDQLRSDLLAGERTPSVLILVTGPEFFNENNHQLSESIAANSDLQQLPRMLARAGGLAAGLAALRPLTRGVENIAIFLSRRHESEALLRWMMVHHGGGQFCFSSDACDQNNKAMTALFRARWAMIQEKTIPTVREKRFSGYALGEGAVHEGFLSTIQWAEENGVALVLARPPFHQTFQDQIPTAVHHQIQTYTQAMEAEHGFSVFVTANRRWPKARPMFSDPDHLSPIGSRQYTEELCKKVIVPLLDGED